MLLLIEIADHGGTLSMCLIRNILTQMLNWEVWLVAMDWRPAAVTT